MSGTVSILQPQSFGALLMSNGTLLDERTALIAEATIWVTNEIIKGDEMIEIGERIAKAIADCNGHDWEHYCDEATAALAAMREPTPEMKQAGADQLFGLTSEGREIAVATLIWHAMHAAALEEKESE